MEFYKESNFKTTKAGEIPSGWNIAALEDYCSQITDGSHFSPNEDKNGDYKIATVANIKNDKIDLNSCKKISKDEYEKLTHNGCRPNKGDILFSKDGTVGLSFSYKQGVDIVLLSSIAIIRPKKELYSDYGAYILKLEKVFQQIVGSKRGTGLSRIILKDLRKVKIPIPNKIEEQRQIASILSRVDDTIQKTDEIIQKTQLLKKALMQELLTKGIGHKEFKYSKELGCEIPKEWNDVEIGDSKYSTLLTGGTPSTKKKEYWNGTVPWMASGDIHMKYIKEVPGRITQLGLKNSAAKYIPVNSVLVALNGQGKTKGTVAINQIELTCNQSIAAYVLNKEEFDPFFILHYLTSKYVELRSLASNNDRAGLNLRLLRGITVPKPPLSEQRQIASILSRVDDQIEKERQTKEQLERLKKGLMQILLTGKVRVKVN